MKSVNIGILAHVDAGKTSLTERLLFDAGVIDHIGSVDRGDTQTDSHEIERRRGITVRSAVVTFTVGDVKVNLIDTPGHPDFISEVERALGVLDGVILVVSAVEGVQAQTRLLMRTLVKLRMPVIIFVNKVDRMGARYDDLLASIRASLTDSVVAMSTVEGLGTPQARVSARSAGDERFAAELAELLAERDDAYLARYLDDTVTADDHTFELARQTREALLHPVLFGSAVRGAGITELVGAITTLFPLGSGTADGLSATVFKIERGWAGEKVAYVRLRSGRIGPRSKVTFYRRDRHGAVTELTGRTTVVEVFDQGASVAEATAVPGDIAKVWGLRDVRIGDRLGTPDGLGADGLFAPPSLETVVRPVRPGATPQLYEALRQLADQDPFIDVRQNDDQEVSVRLYGEVQKEVIQATLADDYGLEVVFEGASTICVEKVAGTGEAVERMGGGQTFFYATVGLRVEPGLPDSGLVFKLSVELGALPFAYHKAIEDAVRATLQQGLYGWEVLDCLVTLVRTGYASPISAAGDFRKVTPLVLMSALMKAGTTVCEPIDAFEVEAPIEHTSTVLAGLVESAATPDNPEVHGAMVVIEGTIPAREAAAFERRLPSLSQGAGVFTSRFHGFAPVRGANPTRRRTGANPLDSREYLLHTLGRI